MLKRNIMNNNTKKICPICCEEHTPYQQVGSKKTKNKFDKEDIFSKKCLMGQENVRPLTIKVHKGCNQQKSKLDPYLEKLIGYGSEALYFRKNGPNRSHGKRKEFFKDIKTVNGNLVSCNTKVQEKAYECIKMMTRELYYYHYGELLYPNIVDIQVNTYVDQIPTIIKTALPYSIKSCYVSTTFRNITDMNQVMYTCLPHCNVEQVTDNISYYYLRTLDCQYGSFWAYNLYGITVSAISYPI